MKDAKSHFNKSLKKAIINQDERESCKNPSPNIPKFSDNKHQNPRKKEEDHKHCIKQNKKTLLRKKKVQEKKRDEKKSEIAGSTIAYC